MPSLVKTLLENPGSVATSTVYVGVTEPVRTAFENVNVTGCWLNLNVAPFDGWAARGDVKLTLGADADFEQAADSDRLSAARTQAAIRSFMGPPRGLELRSSPASLLRAPPDDPTVCD